MRLHTWLVTVLSLLASPGVAFPAFASSVRSAQPEGLRALDGEWIYVEDRTEGRALEQLGPPMSSKFSMRVEEGATVIEGGSRPDGDGLAGGFYLRPTILDGCTNEMVVAREEIFGPVVSVIEFDTEEDAIRLANDTPYGLSGSLWTRDGARQLRVARALRTGAIGVNSNSSVFPQAPFGGYKASGVGKELGMEGLVHNTELKSVFVSTEP